MSLTYPRACTIGETYIYAPSFAAAINPLHVGDALDVGVATADLKTTGGAFSAYAWIPVPVLAGLHVECLFNSRWSASTVSDYAHFGGCGVFDSSVDPTTHNTTNKRNRGAWHTRLSGGNLRAYTGDSIDTFDITALTSAQNYVGNKITIDVGAAVNTSGTTWMHTVTVRLEIPDVGLDVTRVFTNSVGSAGNVFNGFVGICGNTPSSPNTTSFTQLYITGDGLTDTCYGDIALVAAVLPDSAGKITHARIIKEYRNDVAAEEFHNLMKGKTA